MLDKHYDDLHAGQDEEWISKKFEGGMIKYNADMAGGIPPRPSEIAMLILVDVNLAHEFGEDQYLYEPAWSATRTETAPA